MSRHRNFRGMDYNEEYEGYFDVYGHSVPEDEYCISPSTAEQFLYRRDSSGRPATQFVTSEADIKEEEEEETNKKETKSDVSNDSQFRDEEAALMQSCLLELHNVVGDTIPDAILKAAVLKHKFNVEKAIDEVLTNQVGNQLQEDKKKVEDVIFRTPALDKTKVDGRSKKKTLAVPVLTIDRCRTPESSEGGVKKTFPSNRAPVSGFEIVDDAQSSLNSTPKTSRSNSRERNSSKQQRDSSNNRNESVNKEKAKLVSAYLKKIESGKQYINLVVVGHVDAGKSTLMGHLLYRLGCVNKKTMHKYEQESRKLGKSSFAYAWVLDETGEERSRGITMDIAQSRFETDHKVVTLLDAPGHKDFIPNMITGASQADVAMLVVDATRGEFETGFKSGGQTREHAILIRSLGVSQIIVAINKLDNVDWSKERFHEICETMRNFLKQVGFKEADVRCIPCSGLTGENLTVAPDDKRFKSWYEGSTLIEGIDAFSAPERPVTKPLRLTVSDVFKGLTSGFCIAGLVETGCLQTGDKCLVMPSAEQVTLKGITMNDTATTEAYAGDLVVLSVSGADMNNISAGNIMCDIQDPIGTATVIKARIVVFNVAVPLTKGFPVVFHHKSLTEQAVITKLICTLHKSSGEVTKKKPRCVTKNSNAEIEVTINRPVCIELYQNFKELGRFMLRSSGSTIAAGLVTQIIS